MDVFNSINSIQWQNINDKFGANKDSNINFQPNDMLNNENEIDRYNRLEPVTCIKRVSYQDDKNVRKKPEITTQIARIQRSEFSQSETSLNKLHSTRYIKDQLTKKREKEFNNQNTERVEDSPKLPELKSPHQWPHKIIENVHTGDDIQLLKGNLFQRSKSDVSGNWSNPTTTRRSIRSIPKKRSKSNQPQQTEISSKESPKKRSYSQEDARRYIEEQKKKRSMCKNVWQVDKNKIQLDKEEIKKRLQELQKNTRKIISKNLEKKQKKTDTATSRTTQNGIHGKYFEGGIKFKKPIDRKKFHKNEYMKTIGNIETDRKELMANNTKMDEIANGSKETSFRNEKNDNGHVTSNEKTEGNIGRKHIGLLRKPEQENYTYGAINESRYNKESDALEMLTPHISTPQNECRREKIEKCDKKSQEHIEEDKGHINNKDYTLEIPPVQLKPNESKKKSVEVQVSTTETRLDTLLEQNNNKTEEKDLPYWLKPSAVQIYPYNFIMAVRRKLEAITRTPQAHITEYTQTNSTENKITSTRDLKLNKELETRTDSIPNSVIKEYSKVDTMNLNTQPETALDGKAQTTNITPRNTMCLVNELMKSAQTITEDSLKSKSVSELNVKTLSSISINMSSNNISEVCYQSSYDPENFDAEIKSKHTQRRTKSKSMGIKDDDDTTVSSSIFNSPRKGAHTQSKAKEDIKSSSQVSPLSLENVEQLKISTRISKSSTTKSTKTSDSDSTDTASYHLQQYKPKQLFNDQTELDMNELLSDFNRSLTQVIEVNEQLKSTIDKSYQIFNSYDSSKRNTPRTASSDNYSTDFEGSSKENLLSETNKHTATELVKSLKISDGKTVKEKRQYEKELTITLNSNSDHQSTQRSNKKYIVPELVIDSLSNSSAFSKNSNETVNVLTDRNNETEKEEKVSLEYEEQLKAIEQLKSNLQQTIVDSVAYRNNFKSMLNKPLTSSNTSDTSRETTDRRHKRKKHSTETTKTNLSFSSFDESLKSSNNISTNKKVDNLLLHSPSKSGDKEDQSRSAVNESTPPTTSNLREHFLTKNKKQDKTNKSKQTSSLVNEDIKQEHEFSNKEFGDENNSNRIWESTHSNSSYNKEARDKIRENLIKTNVNTTRGDYQGPHFTNLQKDQKFNAQDETKSLLLKFTTTSLIEKSSEDNSSTSMASQVHKVITKEMTPTIKTKSVKSIGNELLKIFNKSDLDISIISSNRSETSLNYSNFGLYEKVIKNETSKSEHLAALLKMREKALLDRAKSQIALLEVQKEKYKSRGLLMELSAIKKKQRAILIKMQKEREEIKRLIQAVSTSTSFENAFHPSEAYSIPSADSVQRSDKVQKLLSPLATVSIRSIQQKKGQESYGTPVATHSAPIIRGNFQLEFSPVLEDLLKKREEDLRKRREHVQNLIQWHQRLDQEEAEVLELERLLLKCNNALPKLHTTNSENTAIYLNNIVVNKVSDKEEKSLKKITESKRSKKMERHLKEIEKSLRELNTLSSSSTTIQNDVNTNTESVDYVRITGHKLNKLWRRLTSQQIDKFEPCKRYKVCKTDLEKIYEEAKIAVLHDFAQDEERIAVDLLEKSDTDRSINKSTNNSEVSYSAGGTIKVPPLNLSPSTVPSTYSESNSGESQHLTNTDISESELETYKTKNNFKPTAIDEKYVKKFEELTDRNLSPHSGLHRSLSDTQIPLLSKNVPYTSTTQQLFINYSKTPATANDRTEISTTQQTTEPINIDNDAPETPLKKLSEMVEYINIPAEDPNIDTNSSTSISNNSDTMLKTLELSKDEDEDILSSNNESSSSSSNDLLKKVQKYTAYAKAAENNFSFQPHTETIKNNTVIRSIETPNSMFKFDRTDLIVNPNVNAKEQRVCDKLSETQSVSEQLSLHSQTVTSLSNSTTALGTDTDSSENSTPKQTPEISEYFKEISTSVSQNLDSNPFTSTEFSTKATSNNIMPEKQISEVSTLTQHSSSSEVKSEDQSPSSYNYSTIKADNDKLYTSKCALIEYEEQLLNEVKNKNQKDYEYESDFEAGSEETRIEDISMPQIETTLDITLSNSLEENQNVTKNSCLLPVSTNDNKTELLPPPPPPLSPISTSSAASCNSQLMPDIINELEVRRCQQLNIENDQLIQFEQVASVSYMYMREIPNKPPPPYVPPAHGSPMTTIFPSEERIKDITYRRTHELYCEYLKTDYISENGEKLPLLIDEKITNIYERIIIDICREYIEEHKEVLMQGDPKNFHSNLAFFNPPDRLRCLQNNIYKEVRRCLAMDKTTPKRAQVYSVYGQRAKRDDIGKIIIQEMYDEDDKWCNSHREENEVINLIVEEMLLSNIREVAKEVFQEEGGEIKDDDAKVLEKSHIMNENDIELDERISTNVKDGKHCKTDNSNIVS